jgi:hypothetical protein
MSRVDTVLPVLPNRFLRIQGTRPSVRVGEGRGSIGTKAGAGLDTQRSLIAARRLYQFMIAEVDSEVLR